MDSAAERSRLGQLDRAQLEIEQLARLNRLLKAILPHNEFYANKLAAQLDFRNLADPAGPLRSLENFAELPFTFKEELIPTGQGHVLATNLTFPLSRYVRYHQTSGTHARPLGVLDTVEDWQWWTQVWQYVLDAAAVTPDDRVLFAFSFGPFVGFWSAFEACAQRGCLVVPSGGMPTVLRLELMRALSVTVLCCTPSYALHLAEVAAEHRIDPGSLAVRKVIVSGEPGGSSAETRHRIEAAWHARVFDHAGATEVGPWGFGDAAGQGLHLIESEFIAEFLSVETGRPAGEGELAELVLTGLGRVGCPVIRYRTGDLVRPVWRPTGFVYLDGGVMGRADDMLIVRGINVFPSAVEQVLRSFPEVIEYRLIVRRAGEMDQLFVEIEDRLGEPQRVAEELRLRLGLKVNVACVPLGSLPRFEGKGRRVVDER